MKKSYLMMAAAATMFAACTQADFVNDIPEQTPKAIEFKNGYIGKSTRSENSTSNYTLNFYDHHNSFSVWGYKSTADDAVFNGKRVNVTKGSEAQSEIYSYDGLVYWDEGSKFYEFYAAAPADHDWKFTAPAPGSEDKKDGYFTTKIELDPTRINQGKGAHLASLKPIPENEEYVKNNDLLIAAPCSPAIGTTVNLEFIHILSRLNIIVSKKGGMTQEVRTFEVSVNNMDIYGEFCEKNDAISKEDLAKGTYRRWTLGSEATEGNPGTRVKKNYIAESEVGAILQDDVVRYVIQTLVIPQSVRYENIPINGEGVTEANQPYLRIVYGVENGRVNGEPTFEKFTKYYNLANIFGKTDELAFNEGWENTLKLTIGPKSIAFSATVAALASATNHENSLGHQDQPSNQ